MSFFNKVAGLRPATLLKKSLWLRCFAVNFAKFVRTRFFTEDFWCLLLFMLLHNPVTFQILPTLGEQVQNWCCVECTTRLSEP